MKYSLIASLLISACASQAQAIPVFPILHIRDDGSNSTEFNSTVISSQVPYSNSSTSTTSSSSSSSSVATALIATADASNYTNAAANSSSTAAASIYSNSSSATSTGPDYTTITSSSCSNNVCTTEVSTALRTTMLVTESDGDVYITTWVPVSTATPSSASSLSAASASGTTGVEIKVTTTDAAGSLTTSTTLAPLITDAPSYANASSTMVTVVACDDGVCTTSTSAVFYSTTEVTEDDGNVEATVYLPWPTSSSSSSSSSIAPKVTAVAADNVTTTQAYTTVPVNQTTQVTDLKTTWVAFTTCDGLQSCVTGKSATVAAVSTYSTIVPTVTAVAADKNVTVINQVVKTLSASTYQTTDVAGLYVSGNYTSSFLTTYKTTQGANVTFVPVSTIIPAVTTSNAAASSSSSSSSSSSKASITAAGSATYLTFNESTIATSVFQQTTNPESTTAASVLVANAATCISGSTILTLLAAKIIAVCLLL